MTRFGIWILFGFWILIFGFPAAAGVIDPLRIGGGARPIAMGRTSTAAPGRLDAIYGNPANSADLIGFGLNSMQVKVAEDVNYTLVGMGVPTKLGIVSIGYLGSIVSGINQTAKTNNRVVSTGTFDYSSSVISLGLARPLSSKLSFGSTLKMYSRSFGGIAGGSASGLGFDIGTLMKLRKNLSLGLSLQNLLPSTLSQLTWTNGTKEELPATFRAGIAFSPKSNLLVALDLSTFTDSPSELRSGIEWQVNHFLALRGGIEYLPSGGLGYRTNPTLGIGLIKRNIGFDYAYYSDGTLAANSTHYFSLSFKFAQKASYSPQKAKTKTVKAVKTEQIGLLEKEQELIRQIESYITLLREKVKAAKVSAQKDKIRELIEFERVKMIAAYKNILLKRKIMNTVKNQ